MGTKSCGSRKTGSGPIGASHLCVPGYLASPLRPALLTWEMDISLQLFHKVMVKIGTQLFNRCYLIPLLSSYVHPHTMIRPGSWEPTGVPSACNLVPPRKAVPMRLGAKASPFLSQALPAETAPTQHLGLALRPSDSSPAAIVQQLAQSRVRCQATQ